ncbi:hypothetical protein AVEN_47536-1 [Araneus ventricosus]|uniref:Uncharacterized protein n=1 Tax=Araneus ventricosus TaxID=182803 RepID=A0A4Y2N8U0_ARAVE|nr:hypothetical protein AVEN_47536-1 [Araneus ventricosus]
MLNVDHPVSSSSQSDCQSSVIFFLKNDFRKDIGALTDSGSLSDSADSFANLSAIAHVSFDTRNVKMLILDKALADISSCCCDILG